MMAPLCPFRASQIKVRRRPRRRQRRQKTCLVLVNGNFKSASADSQLNKRQRHFHHVGESGLAFGGRGAFASDQVVGDRADGQGFLLGEGGVHIERRSLHFHADHAHLRPVHAIGMLVVESVGGEHIAHLVAVTELVAGIRGAAEQVEVGDGSEGAGQLELRTVVGIGTGPLGQDQVAQFHVGIVGTRRADTDDGLHIVEIEELPGIDTDRGNAHAMAHHTHRAAFVGARIAEHAAHVVELHRIVQEFLRNELGAERVAGHQRGFLNHSVLGPDMGRGGISLAHLCVSLVDIQR